MNEIGAIVAADRAPDAQPRGPYPGLRPFLSSEADIFFGREQMADDVLVRLSEKHMVVVHGSSGCGKSSLVAAGVLPQLAARRARRGLKLGIGSFRPGNHPMQALVDALAKACELEEGAAGREQIYRAFAGPEGPRAEIASLAAASGIDQVCILVDQFEELFRFAELESFEEARRFAEVLVALAAAGDEPPRWWEDDETEADVKNDALPKAEISFLVTMRSEFLGDCARYPGLAGAINRTQYLLPNMARSDLIRAVREPVEVFGGRVDHAFAERLAEDSAHEPDPLPLVQHALMQLWAAEDDDRHLTLEDYESALAECGQSEDLRNRSPLGAIFAGHADRVLERVTRNDPERLEAASFIFRALSRKDSEGRVTRCPQHVRRLERISGAPADVTREIIDAFRAEGVSLLTPYELVKADVESDDMIDISHEALIRTWPRMSDESIDPTDTRPVGWVEREAQEAVYWRWLALHAEFFETNSRAYLDGTTTDRVTEWFKTIGKRPEWVRPYLIKPKGCPDVTDEPEWKSVSHLLKQSERKIDRKLVRLWRNISAYAVAAFVLALVAGGLFYKLYWVPHWEQEKAEKDVQTSISVTQAVVADADRKAEQSDKAEQTEVVPEQIATAATGGGKGPVTVNDASEGFVWIGTVERGQVTAFNLLKGGRVTAPNRVQAGDYTVRTNTVVRSGFPDRMDYTPASSIGLITANAPVKVDDVQHYDVNGRREYWAKAYLTATTEFPRVMIGFANGSPEFRDSIARQLAEIGYKLVPSREMPSAAGLAEVVYCHEADREAAVRLAATITRRLALVPGMETVTVAPRLDVACAGQASGRLTVLIDFAAANAGKAA